MDSWQLIVDNKQKWIDKIMVSVEQIKKLFTKLKLDLLEE